MTDMRRQRTFGRIGQVHMVGIGGIGMSSIADVLLRRGFVVTGSDMAENDMTESLREQGAVVHIGHEAGHAEGADVVVYSSAVDPETNPETRWAREHHVPLIGRPEMLGELMRMKFGVGIAGTHGKTTTTTMAGHVVQAGRFDPTVIVGGKVSSFGSNAVSGDGDIIVIEADEYDRTFLRLTPALAVITNIDVDHLDCYRDLDDIRDAFVQYANSVPFFGAAIVCLDDPEVRTILPRLNRRVVTYGTRRQAQVRVDRVEQDGRNMAFDLVHGGERLGRLSVRAPGMHNVLNATAAVAIGLELGIPFEAIRSGLAAFDGVHRRMQEIADVGEVLIVDDYAHHPTEIRASLAGAAACWPDRRIVAVFQPHLFSRTEQLADAFGGAFFDADVVIVTDIYPAREAPIPGVDGGMVARRVEASGHPDVTYIRDRTEVAAHVAAMCRPGDVVLTLGAGDIWRSSRDLTTLLEVRA